MWTSEFIHAVTMKKGGREILSTIPEMKKQGQASMGACWSASLAHLTQLQAKERLGLN